MAAGVKLISRPRGFAASARIKYVARSGPRLAIASESPPDRLGIAAIDKSREPWRREGCGLAQSGPLKLVSR
jgi:hypothetical protein